LVPVIFAHFETSDSRHSPFSEKSAQLTSGLSPSRLFASKKLVAFVKETYTMLKFVFGKSGRFTPSLGKM